MNINSIDNQIQNHSKPENYHVDTKNSSLNQINLQETAKTLAPSHQRNMMHGKDIEQCNDKNGFLHFNFNFGFPDARTDKLLFKEEKNLKVLTMEELLSFREKKI
jgi:hypothetical protein